MYNPESQLNEMLINDNIHQQNKSDNNQIINEVNKGSISGSFNQNGFVDSIGYQNVNLETDVLNVEGAEDSYGFNNELKHENSIDMFGDKNLKCDNIFENNEINFESEEYYKEEGSTSYIGLGAYETNLFDQIPISDFEALAKSVDNDTSLPIANIGRLMKKVLPNTAKVARPAKDMIRDCVTEFIFFISSEASDLCNMERRKTLNVDDIFVAMDKLGFEHYHKPLKQYHRRWKERREYALSRNNPRKE